MTSLALGIGLSAACGFRVFAPLLVLSVAGFTGHFTPAEELAWISSFPALVMFAVATLVEIVAYYIPWADNLLDSIASPAALVAGVLVGASVLGDLPPHLQWTLALVAGGGSAGVVQSGTVLLRGISTATTGGLGNFALATVENTLAVATAVLALIVPLIVAGVVVVMVIAAWRVILRWRARVPRVGTR